MSGGRLFHGSKAKNLLSILSTNTVLAGKDGKACFSYELAEAFSHGADSLSKRSFAIEVLVTLPPEAQVSTRPYLHYKHPYIVTTTVPVPVEIFKLYVRAFGHKTEVIVGAREIEAYLKTLPPMVPRDDD